MTKPRLSLTLNFFISSEARPASVHKTILVSSNLKLLIILVSSGIKVFCSF